MKVIQVLPALELGGVERGTLEIGRALVSAGHQSIVISRGGRLVEQLEKEGSIHVVWDLGKKSFLTFLQIWKLRRWLSAHNPDIVHVRSRMPAWIVWLAWRGMNSRVRPRFLTTLHGMHSVNPYSAIMGRGERVIAVSNTAKQYLLANFPEVDGRKVSVIHRGIDPEEFPRGYKPNTDWIESFYQQVPNAVNKKLICFPGRITRWKGHLDLVNLVSRLGQDRSDFHVVIVGSDPKGHFINEVESAIAAKGLESYFTFLGTRSDMKDIYAQSDLMLSLTSTTAEAFGRTVVECLSIGTPVVAYAHGAVEETLTALYKDGLVEVGDIDNTCTKIVSIFNGKSKPIAENSFTLAAMQDATLDLYFDLCRK